MRVSFGVAKKYHVHRPPTTTTIILRKSNQVKMAVWNEIECDDGDDLDDDGWGSGWNGRRTIPTPKIRIGFENETRNRIVLTKNLTLDGRARKRCGNMDNFHYAFPL